MVVVVVVVSFTGNRPGTPSGGVLVQASSVLTRTDALSCTARAFSVLVQPPRASIKDCNIVLCAGYLSALLYPL